MTKLTILWVGLLSFIAATVIFLFGGAIFQACYNEHVTLLSFQFAHLNPQINCLLYIATVVFLILFVCPIVLTLIIYAIYILIFNRPLPSSHYIVWLLWLIFLYFVAFQLNFIAAI